VQLQLIVQGVTGPWLITAGSPPQVLIEANLSQDGSGNITAMNGQIAAIAKVGSGWAFGDCLSSQSDGMEHDSFQGTINAQRQVNGTFLEGTNSWTVSATFDPQQHTLTGTFSPAAGNACSSTSGALSGSMAFPTLTPSHTYSGQLNYVDGTSDHVQATFQQSAGTLTANVILSGADNGSTVLTGHTVGSAIFLSGAFNGSPLNNWGLLQAGSGSNSIIVYDEINSAVVGTLQ